MTNEKISSWSEENISKNHSANIRMFPTEYMLRALCSKDYFTSKTLLQNKTILDIGCLYANNLVPFHDRNCSLFGVETNQEMVLLAQKALSTWGINGDVRQGTNRKIPFENNFFDIILSIGTIHYEDDLNGIHEAFEEFKRVGKDDCQYLIMTVGTEHDFHKTATRLSENKYQLNTNEFRNGQIMSYFDSKEHFYDALIKHFGKVEIATITESYPLTSLQFWVAKCI
ncbi:MAG: class I SAM-dependent methyltransferase [Desulfobacteraceae bacterium]|nr:class I SAM-dependent methyltransferase [Desulfobacteraceae bacterium]